MSRNPLSIHRREEEGKSKLQAVRQRQSTGDMMARNAQAAEERRTGKQVEPEEDFHLTIPGWFRIVVALVLFGGGVALARLGPEPLPPVGSLAVVVGLVWLLVEAVLFIKGRIQPSIYRY